MKVTDLLEILKGADPKAHVYIETDSEGALSLFSLDLTATPETVLRRCGIMSPEEKGPIVLLSPYDSK